MSIKFIFYNSQKINLNINFCLYNLFVIGRYIRNSNKYLFFQYIFNAKPHYIVSLSIKLEI